MAAVTKMTKSKKLLKVLKPSGKHWVGNGFHVSTMFSAKSEDYRHISPFVLMDYAAPKEFGPTSEKRGVGAHPHRGFETVTFALKGSVDHKDSAGGGGRIGSGDVQWMTAGSGIIHEEFHGKDFAQKGGVFEMIQLWVNLPAAKKMAEPKYQALALKSFPQFENKDATLGVKLIAGIFDTALNHRGPAETHTPINMYEAQFLKEGVSKETLNFVEGTNTLIVQIEGHVHVNGEKLEKGQVAIMAREGESVEIGGEKGARILVLNGEPIDEPIFQYGPFVMNKREEIIEAFKDYEAGKMGDPSAL